LWLQALDAMSAQSALSAVQVSSCCQLPLALPLLELAEIVARWLCELLALAGLLALVAQAVTGLLGLLAVAAHGPWERIVLLALGL
jgi:hypothetical protein